MSYLLEVFGRSLPDSLWPVFRESLKQQISTDTLHKTTARQRADQHVLAGVSALQNSAGGQARLHFDRAMLVSGDDPTAIIGMACAVDMLGQPERARRFLDQLTGDTPGDPRLLYATGLLAERSNRRAQAEELYRQSIYHQPHQRGSRHRLMALALMRRDYETAVQQAETLAAQYPLELPAWCRLGGLHLLNDDPTRAAKAFEQALELLADNWQSELAIASPNYEHDSWQEAVAEIQRELDKDGRCADLHVRLGDIYAKEGMVREALAEYREALHANPYYLEATTKTAACHARRNDHREAARWLGKAIQINETLLMAYAGLTLTQAYMGRDKESNETLELARGIAANTPVLMAEICRLHTAESLGLSGTGEKDETPEERRLARADLLTRSIQAHLAWLTQNQDDAAAWMRLGMLLEADKQTDYARQTYEKAVETYEGCTPAIVRLGLWGERPDSTTSSRLRQAFWPEKIDMATHYELSVLFSQTQRFELTAEKFVENLPAGQNDSFWRNVSLSLEQMAMLNMPKNVWQSLTEMVQTDVTQTATSAG